MFKVLSSLIKEHNKNQTKIYKDRNGNIHFYI